MKAKNNTGFTLIELMIVVVIVGLLSGLAIPRFMKASKKAKVSEPKLILYNIWGCANVYYMETGSWPTTLTPGYQFWINEGWATIGFDQPGGKMRFCYAYFNNDPAGNPTDRIAAATGEAHTEDVSAQQPDESLTAVRLYLQRDGNILVSYDYGSTFE